MPRTCHREQGKITDSMKVDEIERKIVQFINSDNKSYSQFWVDNFTRIPEGDDEVDIDEPSNNLEYMNEGIYDCVVEVDFAKFSFNNLKNLAEERDIDGNLKNSIDAINNLLDKYDREPDKLKKLRIYFFRSLLTNMCEFYNPDLYLEAREEMEKKLKEAEKIINDEGKVILSKTYDSICFVSGKHEGRRIAERISEEVMKVSMDFYERVVSFRNINLYKKDEEQFAKYTTRTDYRKVKDRIVDLLMELEFEEARKVIRNSRIHNSLCEDYIKSIDDMEDGRHFE